MKNFFRHTIPKWYGMCLRFQRYATGLMKTTPTMQHKFEKWLSTAQASPTDVAERKKKRRKLWTNDGDIKLLVRCGKVILSTSLNITFHRDEGEEILKFEIWTKSLGAAKMWPDTQTPNQDQRKCIFWHKCMSHMIICSDFCWWFTTIFQTVENIAFLI